MLIKYIPLQKSPCYKCQTVFFSLQYKHTWKERPSLEKAAKLLFSIPDKMTSYKEGYTVSITSPTYFRPPAGRWHSSLQGQECSHKPFNRKAKHWAVLFICSDTEFCTHDSLTCNLRQGLPSLMCRTKAICPEV